MIMDRFFKKSTCRQLMVLVLLTLICLADGHLIKKRHDASVVSNGNESSQQPQIEEPSETEAESNVNSGVEMTNNGSENNDVNNTPDAKVTSTTDVNNGIEQNFTGNTNSTNQTVNETITNLHNFTKENSQDDSVENRLPSKTIDSLEPKTTRITTVSMKDDENKETQSSLPVTGSSNPSEKPKRLDTTFARSTERTIASDLEVSTVPVSQSTASMLSTIVQSPRVSTTERISTRISPIEMSEKRAKFLSEKVDSSSPSTAHNPDAQWSNLKTVGEVHHNNVTLGKSLTQEDGNKLSVNGKLDSEELAESVVSSENGATQKDGVEHETQLQKSNSSRIVDVSDDNSLSSFQSSSNRPVTQRTKTTDFDDTIQKVSAEQTDLSNLKPKHAEVTPKSTSEIPKLNVVHPKMVEVSTTHGTNPASVTWQNVSPAASSTERSKSEESTERVTENMTESATDVYTTTEEDGPTTIEQETVIPNETTTLSHIPKVKNKENLILETTTTAISTTETTDIPTTIYVSPPPKEDESKVHHKPTQSTVNTKSAESIATSSNTTPNAEIDSTTPISLNTTPKVEIETTRVVTHPTKAIATKTTSTETSQKVNNEVKMSEPIFISTSTTQPVSTTSSPATEPSKAPSPVTPRSITFISTAQPKLPETETEAITPESSPPEHQTEITQGEISAEPADVNAMIAIGISLVAVITLILLVGFLLVMRKRQKQLTYGQRCRPIGLDAYSLDNISVYNSVRRKSAIRASKRAFGNAGFDDPGLKNNPLNISQLATFSQKRVSINEEFKDVPTVTARIEEVPVGCEDKNRYANVVPLPESRVHLKQIDDDEKTEYINANFVKGPKDTTHYYIACQAPLEHTIIDFWRMIWEQNSRVIIMATDLTENGIEKCAEYLPSSFVIDNHVTFGDYQITLKNREVRDKYAVSTVHLRNACTKTWREITHFWYQWPENGARNGVPTDEEASVIAMLLEARSYLKMVTPEQSEENGQAESDLDNKISNGNADKTKSLQRVQGPLTVHCSPGTGRTGTIIACDIAIRSLEQPTRNVDVPQIVYFVRRGRASAVQTREQYEFIYKVAHVYATKLTGPVNE